jgi:methyl-accepting chemotaxis protein
VKSLAEQSASGADEITAQVEAVQQAVDGAAQAIATVVQQVNAMNDHVASVKETSSSGGTLNATANALREQLAGFAVA